PRASLAGGLPSAPKRSGGGFRPLVGLVIRRTRTVDGRFEGKQQRTQRSRAGGPRKQPPHRERACLPGQLVPQGPSHPAGKLPDRSGVVAGGSQPVSFQEAIAPASAAGRASRQTRLG